MKYKEASDYINAAGMLGSKPGLDRIKALCSALGDPQEKVKYIHVAGTNGKGSVCAMLSSVLRCAGYKTGLYTSPHLRFFEERTRINGAMIPKNRLAEIIGRIKAVADTMSDKPTEFEIATAAAFLYFYEEKCDIAVLETGLGGRLDATNVIKSPALSVITGIALDHTAILGDTLEKIAYEKGGIIKHGAPLVLANCHPAAFAVLESIAKENSAPVIPVDYSRRENVSAALSGTSFDMRPYGKISLSLKGVYQADNACTAITAAEALGNGALNIPQEAIKKGLKTTRWQARFEILCKDPLVIYDGAHNPQGAEALADTLRTAGIEKAVFLIGVMADKDYTLLIKTVLPFAKRVFTVTPDNPRSLDAKALAEAFTRNGIAAKPFDTVTDGVAAAIKAAKKESLPLISCGTLYMYGEVRSAINEFKKKGELLNGQRQN
ncbi:MAG: bifunctional folylpolyglutamate synthase/dihydrofolate synthase [Clostridia bacterium]|nr:bifunctional folylpolyglutamate synthase/dihydrofolate synthase [Clostridia bacterium]